MSEFRLEDYLPKEYSQPEEDHIFCIDGKIYQGYTYVADRSFKAFQILDLGDNFLSVFRAYYKQIHNIELPKVKLFLIASKAINAFAVYEESLNSYCIGIFEGVCEQIEENVRSSFEKVKGVLFSEDEAEEWYDRIFVDAIRFFVAHEYAHIVCGHVTKEKDTAQFEFAAGEKSEEENLFQQMKEFQADQMAMAFLCGMAYQDTNTQHNVRVAQYDTREEQFWQENYPDMPKALRKMYLGKKREEFVAQSKEKCREFTHKRLKTIMGGINVVFYTLDINRKAATKS